MDEEDFRYPGPVPQTTEAAIVMLADAVEAAVRSLSDTSPWQIKNAVRKVIWGKLNDGQLDQCNLTLRDLNSIQNAFLEVLSGVTTREWSTLTCRCAVGPKGKERRLMPTEIINRQTEVPVSQELMEAISRVVSLALNLTTHSDSYEVAVSLVGNDEIARLNSAYRGSRA